MPGRRNRFFDLGLTITVLVWGFNYVAIKAAYREMLVPAMSLSRFLITWVVLVVVSLISGESLRYPNRSDTVRILFLGFVASGLYMVVFLEGMAHTTAGEGAVIIGTAPVFVILLSALLGREPFRLGTLLGALVALAGVGMVATSGPERLRGEFAGGVVVLAAALIWAWAVVLTRPLVVKYSPIRVLTLSMAGAAPVIVPFGLKAELSTNWQALSPMTYLMLGHVAVLAGAVGFSCFYAGVKHIGANGAMLYQYCVPPLAALFGWMVLGQPFGWAQTAGMVAVVLGVSLAWRSHGSAGASRKSPEATETVSDSGSGLRSALVNPPQVQLGSNQEE